ncbi:MAG: SagB/ThcOx family dehydrogenase [Chromatiales bacterium]|jgi:SagB-type dehydrogenase family enzyme
MSHDDPSRTERIRRYHELSKHRPDRVAPGPGRLDWANQPDPFRRFDGCARVELALAADGLHTPFAALRRAGWVEPAPVDAHGIGILLELSFGLSAWKSYGPSRWALRCNPSSGNLHPTEAYLVCSDVPGVGGGVYHYQSHDHVLERRASQAEQCWHPVLAGNLLVGLSSIHWREAWKYGVRAYRYCQHDAGHAIAAVRYAAAALGWGARLLQVPGDGEVAALLGLDREAENPGAEPESPDALLAVGPGADRVAVGPLPDPAGAVGWSGTANRLSADHVDWQAIAEVASAARKPRSASRSWDPPARPALTPPAGDLPAARVLRQRRSALGFDGRTAMPANDLFDMLDALLPRRGVPPWDALPWEPRVHPVLFVHRVEGLGPGLYLLPRSAAAEPRLRSALGSDLSWERPAGTPAHLGLVRLLGADLQQAARLAACHQDIAADSAFSLGMLADFEAALAEGAHWYRYLFWESGMLGQVLYLEAEAAGFRGTGIGCFFDDLVHRMLGLDGSAWQDLYHFTVGAQVEDTRLETHPPYAHLRGRDEPGAGGMPAHRADPRLETQ